MSPFDLSDFNLNHLKTLLVLLRVKNTHKAAEILNTTQSAVSRTLSQLRKKLDDQLFIRHARGLTLTPKAEKLARTLPDLFHEVELALAGDQFSPATLAGKLKIVMDGFVMETHGFEIYKAIQQEAPQLNIELHGYTEQSNQDLLNGDMDLGVTFYPLEITKALRQVKIGQLFFVGICRPSHPIAGQNIGMQDLFKNKLAGLIIPQYNQKGMIIHRFNQSTENQTSPTIRSQYINPILKEVLVSDVVFLAPKALLQTQPEGRYSMITVDDEQERHIRDLGLIYNSRFMKSAKIKWLEALIKAVIIS